ncbi:predicted protein [Nematostella vectensis]|uniref:DNA-directed RNA polymerase III subunit RPC6 n=1 Tax=Nematostella vectensis TaxID=45351 RepID=A7SIC4_NEMVE|nr:predicted protein [Nematostella vectensis]|eukprot:XP_001628610.1 predicted protein [Nematostella vectensis]
MAVADIVIKQEAVEAVDLQDRILELCKGTPKGISDRTILQDMPSVSAEQRVAAINRLLSTGKIELLKSGSQLLYKYKDDQQTNQKTKGFELEEKLVYQTIEESSNKGIWIRDIRYKCNLQMTQLNRIIKTLESKKLIKAVKSVAASKKKVYMLFNLEPDESVTGGAWYSDQDFEAEFVEVLNQQCFKYLEQKAEKLHADPVARRNASYAPAEDVWKYITQLGISKVQLSVHDIETILSTLIFDGRVETTIVSAGTSTSRTAVSGQKTLYRAIFPIVPSTGLMTSPCGVCPVIDHCRDGAAISPKTCIYMKDWLDL